MKTDCLHPFQQIVLKGVIGKQYCSNCRLLLYKWNIKSGKDVKSVSSEQIFVRCKR